MEAARDSALGALRRGRRLASAQAYALLLLLILVSLAFQLAAPDESWPRLVWIALQSATLVAALWVSGAHPWVFRLAIVACALAIIAAAGLLAGSGEVQVDAGRGVMLLLVALAPASIAVGVVREIRAAGTVTVGAMFGVLCIYLLLGMLFAWIYGMVDSLEDTSFFAEAAGEPPQSFLYFSYVTITTTGYGDLTAATPLGRSMAITEALVGQIYLVTVVALIVGNLARSRGRADA